MTAGDDDDEPLVTDAATAGLPAPIAADLVEAGACISIGAYRGAGLLARRAIEQVVVLRRVPLEARTFRQKVAWLLQAGHLPPTLAADARTVAAGGTAAAHGGEALSSEEARGMVRAALVVAAAVLQTGPTVAVPRASADREPSGSE